MVSIQRSDFIKAWQLCSCILSVVLPLTALLADHGNNAIVIMWLCFTCVLNIATMMILIHNQEIYTAFLDWYYIIQLLIIYLMGSQKFANYAAMTFIYTSTYVLRESFIHSYRIIRDECKKRNQPEQSDTNGEYELVLTTDSTVAQQA